MASFHYTAIDGTTGRQDRGSVAAATQAEAVVTLKARGLYPTQVVSAEPVAAPQSGDSRPSRRRRWQFLGRRGGGAKSKTLFTRQMATLLKAGMPILRGLEVLARQQPEGAFKKSLIEIAETIKGGGSFSDGLSRFPRYFDPLYLNMVRAGEAAGALDVVMARLAEFLEKSQKIRGKVKSAMTYPLIIMSVAVAVVGALIVFVIPRFESIFANMLKGQPLPALTQAVLAISKVVQEHLLLSALAVGVGCWGARALLRTRRGRAGWDRTVLPCRCGRSGAEGGGRGFARTLGTLLASGVQILPALNITRDTAGNGRVAAAVDQVRTRVRRGGDRALDDTALFPAMVRAWWKWGRKPGGCRRCWSASPTLMKKWTTRWRPSRPSWSRS